MGRLGQKQQTTEVLRSALDKSTVTVAINYRGLTVGELTALRHELHKENAQLTVVKNTLLRRIFADTEQAEFNAIAKGPTALAIGTADQIQPAKILKEFIKKTKKEDIIIKGGILDGKVLSAQDVETLASLPPLDELRAKLLGAIAGPSTQLVAALNNPQRSLVYALSQLGERKQQAGE